MKFYAIKPGITYFGHEIYEIEIEIEGNRIKGVYKGKMLSREEKIWAILEGIFYGFLGRIFFGTPGMVLVALGSPDVEIRIGKPEEDERKNFSFEFKKIKIGKRKMKVKNNKKKLKFIISEGVSNELRTIYSK